MRVTTQQLVAEVDRVARLLPQLGLEPTLENALLLMAAELIELRRHAPARGYRRGRG